MDGIITLLTDFGTADHYVSAMKGVILGINPSVNLVDISHQVQPQNIAQTAFLLDSSWKHFPPGTIHLVVVDPQVGSQRQLIILKHHSVYFVAPDNGVLSYIFTDEAQQNQLSQSPKPQKLKAGLKAVSLSEHRFWRPSISATFHGRDIMAPVAAYLSLGTPLEEFGPPVTELITLPLSRPISLQDKLIGHVIHIDSFGNLISDIHSSDLPPGDLCIEISGQKIHGLSQYYAQKEGLIALIDSSDRLEIAQAHGSAAVFTRAGLGCEIIVKLQARA